MILIQRHFPILPHGALIPWGSNRPKYPRYLSYISRYTDMQNIKLWGARMRPWRACVRRVGLRSFRLPLQSARRGVDAEQ